MAAVDSVDLPGWQAGFEGLFGAVQGRFARAEPRRTARDFVLGLLSSVERKNSWWLAEHTGYATPLAMQRLLYRAVWDADAVRDDLRAEVLGRLAHPDGVLVPDETGFLKKGTGSAGVQRQYSGTAGRIENSQVAVFLAYVSPHGRALLDRRLYLPDAAWCADADRRDKGRDPTRDHICDQAPAGHADDHRGPRRRRTHAMGDRGRGLRQRQCLPRRTGTPPHRLRPRRGLRPPRARLQRDPSRRHRGGDAAPPAVADPLRRYRVERTRDYDWAWINIDRHPRRWLLIRRNLATGELAFYRCWAPHPVPLATIVAVAGSRWAIEELFQAGKNQVGLDHYQVRTWRSWHRFITLAMLALALLAIISATTATPVDPMRHAHDREPIAFTVAEIRHLIAAMLIPARTDIAHLLAWSTWRRTTQAQARRTHYRRRLGLTTVEQQGL